MRWTRNEVRAGMSVTSTKGERLGNVIRMGAETFVVERGVFFPKDYELRYDHITALSSDQISYSLSDADSRLGSTTETARAGTGTGTLSAAVATAPAASTATARRIGLDEQNSTRSAFRSWKKRSASRRSHARRGTSGSTRR